MHIIYCWYAEVNKNLDDFFVNATANLFAELTGFHIFHSDALEDIRYKKVAYKV